MRSPSEARPCGRRAVRTGEGLLLIEQGQELLGRGKGARRLELGKEAGALDLGEHTRVGKRREELEGLDTLEEIHLGHAGRTRRGRHRGTLHGRQGRTRREGRGGRGQRSKDEKRVAKHDDLLEATAGWPLYRGFFFIQRFVVTQDSVTLVTSSVLPEAFISCPSCGRRHTRR